MITTAMITNLQAKCYICLTTNDVDLDDWTFVCHHCGSEGRVKVPQHVQDHRPDDVGNFWAVGKKKPKPQEPPVNWNGWYGDD